MSILPAAECDYEMTTSDIRAIDPKAAITLNNLKAMEQDTTLRPCPKCDVLTKGNAKQPDIVCQACSFNFCFFHGNLIFFNMILYILIMFYYFMLLKYILES